MSKLTSTLFASAARAENWKALLGLEKVGRARQAGDRQQGEQQQGQQVAREGARLEDHVGSFSPQGWQTDRGP